MQTGVYSHFVWLIDKAIFKMICDCITCKHVLWLDCCIFVQHKLYYSIYIFNINVCNFTSKRIIITKVRLRHYRFLSLQWRHNDHDGVSIHQPHGCLLNRLFRRRSKKTSKLCVTGLCVGNSPGPVNSPHEGPVTRKMFPFDDVIIFMMGIPYLADGHDIKLFFASTLLAKGL